jgi:DNA-binding CsgD family transcriptional regulator
MKRRAVQAVAGPVGTDGLLERGDELALLEETIEASLRGDGALAIVQGPAGIGKTALLERVRHQAGESGLAVLSARAGELEADFAYGVARQLLEPPLAGPRGRGRRGKLTAARRTRLLAGPAQPAERVVGAPAIELPLEPQQDVAYGVLHGLYWLTLNLADEQPLLLCVDDAQWVDRPSLRFLVHLARRLEGTPVGIVVAVRSAEPDAPEDLLAELAGARVARMITPEALSAGAVETLVRAGLGRGADEAFCAACHRASAGNPLYLAELLRALSLDDISPAREQVERVAEIWPESVQRHVLRRVARLGAEAGRLAQATAVLGSGSLRTAARLAELDLGRASALADALVEIEILESPDPFAFIHPVVRLAIEGDMASHERDALHVAAARLLADDGRPAQEVAAHMHRVRAAGRDWCVAILRQSARDALARGASEVSVSDLRRALAEPAVGEERRAVLLELGIAEEHAGDAAAVEHLREAYEVTTEQPARAEAALALGITLSSRWQVDEALAVLARGVEELDDLDCQLSMCMEIELVFTSLYQPRWGPDGTPRLARLAEREVEGPARMLLLAARGFAAMGENRPREEALALAREALTAITFEAGRSLQQAALEFMSMTLMLAEDYESCRWVMDSAVPIAEAGGVARELFAAHCGRAFLAERLGALAEAETHARIALEVLAHRHQELGFGWPLLPLVETLTQRGELDAADEALALVPEHQWPSIGAWQGTLAARGRLRYAQDRYEESLADCLESGCVAEPDMPGAWQWRSAAVAWHWRASAALALDALRRREEALEYAYGELELARTFGAPRALGLALRVAGTVERGEQGLVLLREAVAILETSPALLERARAYVHLGALLRREGERTAARDPLRAGLDLARRCGATPLAQFAREELVAAGAKPRRDMVSGRDALTAAELRVAQLAAEGATNRKIAQSLYLSPKTVEMHLGRAYRKLDIASRAELATTLAETPGSAADVTV